MGVRAVERDEQEPGSHPLNVGLSLPEDSLLNHPPGPEDRVPGLGQSREGAIVVVTSRDVPVGGNDERSPDRGTRLL